MVFFCGVKSWLTDRGCNFEVEKAFKFYLYWFPVVYIF